MFRFVIAIILFVLALVILGGGWYLAEKLHFQPERELAVAEAEAAAPPPEDPGRAAWRMLAPTLAGQDPVEGLSSIRQFLANYPGTEIRGEVLDELSRIGGRWLFSSIPAPWKEPYRVVSGDSLHRISSRTGAAPDWIMKVNNLLSYDLSIGQELLIPQPELRLVLSRAEGRLFIYDNEDALLLAYPVTESGVTGVEPGIGTIRERIATFPGGRPAFGTPEYIGADKRVMVDLAGIEFMALPEAAPDGETPALPRGFLLQRPDMEELFLMAKRGTSVTVE